MLVVMGVLAAVALIGLLAWLDTAEGREVWQRGRRRSVERARRRAQRELDRREARQQRAYGRR